MKSFSEKLLLTLFAVCFYGGGLFVYIFGVYHAFSKHSSLAGAGSMFLPPVAIYFAVESFWHEEEWEEVYEDYSQVFAHLLFINANQTFSNSEKSDLIIQKGKIKRWVELMPKEEKEKLKASGVAVIEFVSAQNRDVVKILVEGEKFESSKFVEKQINIVKNELSTLENEYMRLYLLDGLQQVVPEQIFDGLDSFLNEASGKSSDKIELQRFLLSSVNAREKNAYTYLDTFFN